MKHFRLFFLFLVPFSLFISYPFQSSASMAGKGGLIPMPTEQEMKEIEQFLSTLSEEELEQFAEIGRELMQKADELNIPLYDTTPVESKNQLPPKPEKRESKKEEPIKLKESKPKSDVEDVQKTLDDIITCIASIRQKTSNDHELEDMLSPLDAKLNTLTYYLHVVSDKKIAGKLKDVQFISTFSTLKFLHADLKNLDSKFSVPETHSFKTSVNNSQIKKAENVLQQIIKTFRQYFDSGLNEDLEKIIKHYEPEALKIKKELENKEKRAHEAVKKLPVTNNAKPSFPSGGSFGSGNYAPPVPNPKPNLPAQPLATPTTNSNLIQPKSTATSPTGQKPTAKKPTSKPKVTLSDLEKGIESQLDKIESTVSSGYSDLSNYFGSYSPLKQQSPIVSSALGEANFALKKLKTTITEWYKQIDSSSSDGSDFQTKTKKMQDLFNSGKHQKLKSLHTQTKNLAKSRAGLDGNAKRFYELMNEVEKKLTSAI